MLRRYTEIEEYEKCVLIQNELEILNNTNIKNGQN